MKLRENFSYDKMFSNNETQYEKNELYIKNFVSKTIGIVKITEITDDGKYSDDFDIHYSDYLVHFDITENNLIEKIDNECVKIQGLIEYDTDIFSIVNLPEELDDIKPLNDINMCYNFLLSLDRIKLKRLMSLFQLKKIAVHQFHFIGIGRRPLVFTFQRKPVFSQLLNKTIKDCFPDCKIEERHGNIIIKLSAGALIK